MSLIDALEYQDPQITQYTIFNPRIDGTEYNFGEMYGGLSFGFVDQRNFGFPKLDTRIGRFMLDNKKFGFNDKENSFEKEIEMTNMSPEHAP